jgi:nucleoside-triphosphatase THEP1
MLPGSRLEAPVRVVVVTGPTGGGKTSAVLTVAESLRERGLQLAGFVQIGEFEDDRKTGFRLRDVATGEEADLAFLAERGEGEFGTRFRFSDEGFGLGREALARAAAGTVVIIDELGPVELRGQGHMPAVRDALATPGLRGAIIVVRRALVPSLLGELDASDAVVCDVAHTGGDFVESVVSGLGSPKS